MADVGLAVATAGGAVWDTRFSSRGAADFARQSRGTVQDFPGGSGWFLAIGCLIAGARPVLLQPVASDLGGLVLQHWARLCGVEVTVAVDTRTTRFVTRLHGAEVSSRVVDDSECSVGSRMDIDLGEYGAVLCGYVSEDELGALCDSLDRTKPRPLVAFAPSNSIATFTSAALERVALVADLIVVNRHEFVEVGGRASSDGWVVPGWARSARRMVVTDGAAPIRWRSGGEEGEVRVPEVHPIDVIGLGDIFAACTALHVLNHRSISDAVHIGAMVATSVGGVADPREKIRVGRSRLSRG